MKRKDTNTAVIFRNGMMISNSARNGAPKKLTMPPPAHGMKRATSGDLHPYLHGQALKDEPNTPLVRQKQVPVHPGMGSATPKHRGTEGDGSATLEAAGRLGNATEREHDNG